MRSVLLALGIAVCIVFLRGWVAPAYHHAMEASLSDEARSAIELRCRGRHGDAARHCRSLHEKLYLAGTLDPDRTLRAYCTRSRTVEWRDRRPAPPAVCVQYYGGWQKG